MMSATSTSKRSRQQLKRLYYTSILIFAGTIFAILILLVQPFFSLNKWISDQLFTSETPSQNIVIVGIDDDTLQVYGRWADWSRNLHGQAIDNLSEARAKVIGVDIIFADSSTDDQLLTVAIENSGNVILPTVGTDPLPAKDIVTYNQFLSPIEPLEQACKSIGHANLLLDTDGTVRRLPLVVKDSEDQSYPAFILAILHAHFNMSLPEEYLLQDGALHLLARNIPVDASYSLLINFAANTESFSYISYGDVISGNFDPSMVSNKIVLIGMTATGEVDRWATPTSLGKMPGVFIHAVAMDTILRQQFLMEANINITMMIILLLVIVIALALPRMSLRLGGLVTIVLFAGYLLASFIAFDRGYIIHILYPLLIIPLMYMTSVLCRVVIEQRDKQFVKNLFGRYVSPQVSREILSLADAGRLELGGEQRETTVLFADIRNFTSISEQLSPEALVNMLNTYLSVIIDKVLENGGMVNKFAGDSIMAVWNAPQPQSEHARLAVKTAVESQQRIAELQKDEHSLQLVQFGIGINTGEVLAGNVGSLGRVEYTIIGDTVNLAARICSATPGDEIYIGAETCRQVLDYIQVEQLEPQSFKGKAEQVIVYRVIGWL
ncbi:CHASE2 domain-containing protein [Chloroflexota bacterium]